MNRVTLDEPVDLRVCCSAVCAVALIAAWTIRSSVTCVALERGDGLAARHHDHAVAEALELKGVARGDHDRHAARGDLAEDAVDLGPRADVDALRRLVGDEDGRLGQHRARHHDLLLVAAGERRDRSLERRRPDRQLDELVLDRVDLAAPADEGTGREPVERRERGVLADVQIDHQALGQAIGRHVGGVLHQRTPRESLAVDLDRSGRRGAPGERTQQGRLAVADHACDAHDLALPGSERDVVEALPAQSLDPQQRSLAGLRSVLRREGRLERAADDQGEEVVVRDVLHRGRAAIRPVAQDGDAVGDLADLAEPVGDVDDRRPFRGQLPDGGEEPLDRVLRERSRRLVEDQQLRRDGERLGQLEQVAAGDAEQRDAVLEMAAEVDVVEQRAHRLLGVRFAAPQVLRRHRDPDVLGDRHVREQRWMLVHDRDPELLRGHGRELLDRLAPAKTIVPSSGEVAPEAMFISVDFPAPFSPSSACTSPGSTSNETSLSAAIAS